MFALAPGEDGAVSGEGDAVRASQQRSDDAPASKGLDLLGQQLVLLVAVAQLATCRRGRSGSGRAGGAPWGGRGGGQAAACLARERRWRRRRGGASGGAVGGHREKKKLAAGQERRVEHIHIYPNRENKISTCLGPGLARTILEKENYRARSLSTANREPRSRKGRPSPRRKHPGMKRSRLRSDWEEVVDAQTGSTYYWNTRTNAVSWGRPTEETATPQDPTALQRSAHEQHGGGGETHGIGGSGGSGGIGGSGGSSGVSGDSCGGGSSRGGGSSCGGGCGATAGSGYPGSGGSSDRSSSSGGGGGGGSASHGPGTAAATSHAGRASGQPPLLAAHRARAAARASEGPGWSDDWSAASRAQELDGGSERQAKYLRLLGAGRKQR